MSYDQKILPRMIFREGIACNNSSLYLRQVNGENETSRLQNEPIRAPDTRCSWVARTSLVLYNKIDCATPTHLKMLYDEKNSKNEGGGRGQKRNYIKR